MASGPAIDLELMRASALLDQDPAAAVHRAGQMLEQAPGHEGVQLLLAMACRRLGDPAKARELLESLLRTQPNSATLQLELGRAYASAGLTGEATAALEAAVALGPRLAEAWQELAAQRFLAGDTRGGDVAYAHFLGLRPLPPELHEATAALEQNRLAQAETQLQQRLRTEPTDVIALRMLARLASVRRHFPAAEQLLARCLQLAPGYADARFDLATELCVQHRLAEAQEHLDRLLAAEPRNPNYIGLKAQALRQAGRNAEARALLAQAIARDRVEPNLYLLYGHELRDAGDQRGAVEAYRNALAIRPGFGEAYRSLADLKTVRFTAEDRAAMALQLTNSAPGSAERMHLEFALGKALEDDSEYQQAFVHYAAANAAFKAMSPPAVDVLSAGVRRAKALYTPQFFAERNGWGSESSDPVFIVGMPRSGSTLVEQILASHSQVEGTRELPHVPAIALELMLGPDPYAEADYPIPVGALSRAQVGAYAARYLQQTLPFRTLGKPRFVDKTLANFDHVGLIQLMFPSSAIIDVRRHPLGCCFSCFRQYFGRGHPYSYDLGELARHYRNYAELMAHFDMTLPGRVHRVHYEQLVADPEGVVRRLLEYCKLPFEAECLRFYENRRAVSTLSSEQVRRPIYTDGVGQWRHFEPWLGELRQGLGDLIERYPA